MQPQLPPRLTSKIHIAATHPGNAAFEYTTGRTSSSSSKPHTRRQSPAIKAAGCIPRNPALMFFNRHTSRSGKSIVQSPRRYISLLSKLCRPHALNFKFCAPRLRSKLGRVLHKVRDWNFALSREMRQRGAGAHRSFWDVANFDRIAAPAARSTGSAGTRRPRASGLLLSG